VNDDLAAVLLALGATLSWGLGAVLVRIGLRDLSTVVGTQVSLISGLIFVAALVALFQPSAAGGLTLGSIGLFALIGILNFPMGRFFNYMSLSLIGVGRATPLLASSPLFAMVLAVAFTGETVSLTTAAGTALILAGLYVTLSKPVRRRNAVD
jgi:drug/metabolite transporter (DMT)-like permease